MKVEGLSEKAMRFEGANFGLPLASKSGVLFHIIEIDNWLRVMIEVGEDTTSKDIRQAVPLALEWRNRLLQWQGPWLRGGDNHFFFHLDLMHKHGYSYADLAESINGRLSNLLHEHVNYVNELKEVQSDFKTMLDFYLWRSKFNQFALEHARDILKLVKLNDNEIECIVREGITNIVSGNDPFNKGDPIDRERIIATLRTWRNSEKHKVYKRKQAEEDGKL